MLARPGSDRAPLLTDRIPPCPRILFVGINPGVRSAAVNHHFAGHSNRFWKLLFDSGVTPERLRAEEDDRMMDWGFGLTNLIPRTTPGIGTLEPAEYAAGLRVLRRKVRRVRPQTVAFLGLTLYRFVFGCPSRVRVTPGWQVETFEAARVFVLPNPSGRNAHFSYAQLVAVFRQLARHAWPPAV